MDATDRLVAAVSAADAEDDATAVDVCPSCRAQGLAAAAAQRHGLVITFVVVGGARLPWTAIVRRGEHVEAVASGHRQEDALFDALARIGLNA